MNIHYHISEVNINKDNVDNVNSVDIDKLVEDINTLHKIKESKLCLQNNYSSNYGDLITAFQLDYSSNYTVKMLKNIMEYYDIFKCKMLKQEMIDSIILFEEKQENFDIVERRKRLWKNINELKQDHFFSKYILFDC